MRALNAGNRSGCLSLPRPLPASPSPAAPAQLVYDHAERQLAASLDEDDAGVALRRLEEELLAGGSSAAGPGDCPSRLHSTIEGLHDANIIAVECLPHQRLAISGGSDGSVAVFGYDGGLRRSIAAASSGVLSLALQRRDSSEGGDSSSSGSSMVVAAGCMDGSVLVLDAGTGDVLARSTPHRKYVVACRWAPDGRHLVTAAWDNSFAVHRLQRCSGGGGGGGWQLEQVHAEQTAARVNALEFITSGGGHAGSSAPIDSGGGSSTFLVAVQGSNYLQQLTITGPTQQAGQEQEQATAAAAVREEKRINLNGPTGDDHVSFSAAHLALSPCGRLLLVSADNGRLLVYDTHSWVQVRSLIGLPIEQFHQFAAAWSSSGHYVIAGESVGGHQWAAGRALFCAAALPAPPPT